jgi:hypothetical protein
MIKARKRRTVEAAHAPRFGRAERTAKRASSPPRPPFASRVDGRPESLRRSVAFGRPHARRANSFRIEPRPVPPARQRSIRLWLVPSSNGRRLRQPRHRHQHCPGTICMPSRVADLPPARGVTEVAHLPSGEAARWRTRELQRLETPGSGFPNESGANEPYLPALAFMPTNRRAFGIVAARVTHERVEMPATVVTVGQDGCFRRHGGHPSAIRRCRGPAP